MSGKSVSKVDNTVRKSWDKATYESIAKEREAKDAKNDESGLDARKRKRQERDPLHQGLIVERANLRARDYQIDLASNLHKSQMVSVTGGLSQQGGYYCKVCDCVLKDSMSYLDHINGKYHNRALGMSMRVEQSTADQVRKAIAEAKKQKQKPETLEADYLPEGLTGAVDNNEEDDEDDGEKSEEKRPEEEDADSEMAAMMGFGGFGSSKQ
ncbi:hypothetical protein H632_c262p1 [Helicosporidium sp. ATCC 50920]|nr:hypothetical protein H632_c262p1 [Helicosporidium sp. ATCC 50920]|eukprot:KDD76339.1 hypothetical protein H632_c262p1 [Helicosporidium sp. ATCC 50920]